MGKGRRLALALAGVAALSAAVVVWAAAPGTPSFPTTSSPQSRLLAAQPGASMTLAVGDDVRVFEVAVDGVTGSGLELRRFPGHLRGHVGTESVDMTIAPPRITGQLGDQEISLDMLPAAQGMRVAGRFGERDVALVIRPEGIDGIVGPCRYQLKLEQTEYAGQVGCGGQPDAVRLDVPVAFVARGDGELTAMLVAILAR